MNTRRRVDPSIRAGKGKAVALGLLVVSLVVLGIAVPVSALPMLQSDAAPCPSRFIGASPLEGPEFYVERARCEEISVTVDAIGAASPLQGPEFYAERAWSDGISSLVDRIGSVSPLHGPEFYVERARFGEVSLLGDETASPLDGPEFYVNGDH